MKMFDGMQSFFNSIGEYVKNFSNLFLIFLGAFALISVIMIFITSFAYECKLTKTIDKINKFLERNPRINDDNLVAFNNLMKARDVPKTLRRQWQQFMLYREHPASYYMSFKHCVENPLRNSTYRQQMTVYKVISYVLVALSLVVSTFMAVQSFNSNLVLQDIVIIPITILVCYWLISMVLDLVHSAVSGDLFQNYQYFEINIDKAMLTLPEFVDYEVLFSQDEIRHGIPVLFAYLQKRAIQEQHELEKARLKSVDHEKFDFDKAGLDGSLVLDRAMRETENFITQRKKYMQETERVNNEIAVLENNYKEQMKDFQRQVQTSKETVENLKEQLEQATSTIEINYIKKQMRDEINRQQLAEKDFDILSDKHNQEIKNLNQEIKRYDEETKKAKEALEVAMLSEFNTYSVKVYDNLEKIVDDKMQDRVDGYKDQIKGLEIELEEKNEELDNVYTRYQEALAQVPVEEEVYEEQEPQKPTKKNKKKKKSAQNDEPVDEGMVQPEQQDEHTYDENAQYDNEVVDEYSEQGYGDENYDGSYLNDEQYVNPEGEYAYYDDTYAQNEQYIPTGDDYVQDEQYVPTEDEYSGEYVPLDAEQDYMPDEQYTTNDDEQYIPLDNADEYIPSTSDYNQDEVYVPLTDETPENEVYVPQDEVYVPLDNNETETDSVDNSETDFNDSDFDIDFNQPNADTSNFEDMNFNFDFDDNKTEKDVDSNDEVVDLAEQDEDGDFDINSILGLYNDKSTKETSKPEVVETESLQDDDDEPVENEMELSAPTAKRKVGRPRKIVDESEIVPKRKVGRPRKVVDEQEDKPKRKAGRPRKVVDQIEVAPKRKAGRPRKVADETEVMPKRKAGRPRKVVDQVEDTPKRKVGRPKKVVEQSKVAPKRKVGRPKKSDTAKSKGPGRPRKQNNDVTSRVSKGKRGRPRKIEANSQTVLDKPKSRRGRPRKK